MDILRSIHYPCGITIVAEEKTFYVRYTIMEQPDESGANIYNIIDNDDLSIVESYDDKEEAEEAVKFWNT